MPILKISKTLKLMRVTTSLPVAAHNTRVSHGALAGRAKGRTNGKLRG